MIDSFDTNKDGQFDRDEVRSMVMYMLQERKKVQSMKLIVWVILACVVGGAFTVLTMCSAANEISKETSRWSRRGYGRPHQYCGADRRGEIDG